MRQIQSITFSRVVYDESLSHHIFSIADVTFTAHPPIHGALLYWRKNTMDSPFTAEDEYKFFYDLSTIRYYAAVKFPKNTELTKEERQELAYILLEERGGVGSYSISTSSKKHFTSPKKLFKALNLPAFESITELTEQQQLAFWHWHTEAQNHHPSLLAPYLPFMDFKKICATNPYLSEQFLIDHLTQVDWHVLQYNDRTVAHLSSSMKHYMVSAIKEAQQDLQSDIAQDPEYFIMTGDFYTEDFPSYLPESEQQELDELHYFAYDRGSNIWPGSEHLVRGLPSLACQLYDRFGDRKPTNHEMTQKFERYSDVQRQLFVGIADLHWLALFKDQLDWQYACMYNPNLTEDFINAHMAYINFEALGLNAKIKLSEQFITEHFRLFNHTQPVPLVICHLTEQLYLNFKEKMILNRSLLVKYSEEIDDYEYLLIEDLLE